MPDNKLYLIPVDLAANSPADWLGAHLKDCVLPLRRFVAERPKTARQFLKKLGVPLHDLEMEVLDEHSKPHDIERLAGWMTVGGDVGLLSEAGCPAIADPGAVLVGHAHRLGMRVVPLVGPSSIVLALMASGLNGQRFAFNGYLPQAAAERDARIRELEERSRKSAQTEILIEAPYRNDALFAALVGNCQPGTLVSVACDLTAATEEIATMTVGEWRRAAARPTLHNRPAIFLVLAASTGSVDQRRRSAGSH